MNWGFSDGDLGVLRWRFGGSQMEIWEFLDFNLGVSGLIIGGSQM